MGELAKNRFLVLFFVMLLASMIIPRSLANDPITDPDNPCYGCSSYCDPNGELVSCSCINYCDCNAPKPCGSGLVCKNGACVGEECTTNANCEFPMRCSGGFCSYTSYSQKAVYGIKNELEFLIWFLEDPVIRFFKCTGFKDLILGDPGESIPLNDGEVCCGSGEVICGFEEGDGGGPDIQYIKCCKVFSFYGAVDIIPGSWIDPEQISNEERFCNSGVAICGRSSSKADSLGGVKCAKLSVEGKDIVQISRDVNWHEAGEDNAIHNCASFSDPTLLPCHLRDAADCGASPNCKWCPAPSLGTWGPGGAAYSYFLPDQIVSEGKTCVDITMDPFNCGGCGFENEGRSHFTAKTNTHGAVCTGDEPFCANRNCVSVSNARDAANAKYLAAYKRFHPVANEFYTPYTVSTAGGGYVATDPAITKLGLTQIYSLNQIDSDEDACAYSGGTLDEDAGCCGDGKCRVEEGTMCHYTQVCDGSEWHGLEPEENGEVFSTSYCNNPFPVANINGEFTRCVDEDIENDFIRYNSWNPPQACLPDEFWDQTVLSNGSVQYPLVRCDKDSNNMCRTWNGLVNEFTSWHMEYAQGTVSDFWQYMCPAGSYIVGEEATQTGLKNSGEFDMCRFKMDVVLKEPDDGYLVCMALNGPGAIGNANLFGFADIFQFKGVFDYPPGWGSATDSGFCSAAIRTWPGAYSVDVMPCPGVKSVSLPKGNHAVVNYGANAGSRSAAYCSGDYDNSVTSLNNLDFHIGAGSIMGNVSGHDYACFTDYSKSVPDDYDDESRAFIGICCGNTTAGCSDIPGSVDSSAGKRFRAGEFFNTSGGPVYCLGDGRWAFDLDAPELQATCKAAAFNPTGDFCCSEADDKKYFESYNDAGGSGACFLGKYQKNNQNVIFNASKKYPDLYVYNGSVLGCGFTKSDFIAPVIDEPDINVSLNTTNTTNNTSFVDSNFSVVNVSYFLSHLGEIEDWPNPGGGGVPSVAALFKTGLPLVKSMDYCRYLNDSKQGMYCSLNDSWVSANGYVIHKSVIPPRLLSHMVDVGGVNLSGFGCCKKSECWDSLNNVCLDEQLGPNDGYFINDSYFYRCIKGSWVNILGGEKLTPDRCYSGFCSESDQCLFDLFGDSADDGNPLGSPQCLNNGQFKGVFVCNNGSWDTRTRQLGIKLATLVSSDDFSLSCGAIDDVVVLRQNPGLSDVFCTLKSGDVRVLGVLLNQPLIASDYGGFVDSLRQSFWLAYPGSGASFDVTKNCTPGTTNFSECLYAYATAPPKDLLRFYYDREFNMAVISTYDISPTLGQKICSVLPSWLQWLCPSEPEFKQLLKSVGGVEKVYLAKSGSKSVFGFGKNICPDPSLGLAWDYSFNYTGFGLGVVNVLKQGIIADYLIAFNSSIHVWNAHGDVWNSLALLKYE